MEMKNLTIFLTFATCLFIGAVFAQDQSSTDYSWINGKWQGPDWQGGMLVMDLRVVNGNQIKGSGRLPGPGKRVGVSTIITGTVDADKVDLESLGQSSHITTKYVFSLVDGALVGKSFNPLGPADGFDVKFKKLE